MARTRTGRVATPKPKASPSTPRGQMARAKVAKVAPKPKAKPTAKPVANALKSQAKANESLASALKTISSSQKKVADTKRAVAKAAPKPTPSTRGQMAKTKPAASKASPKASPKKPTSFGAGSSKTISKSGKALANVSKAQLDKSGLSLTAYMNKWNKTGSRPS
tara:strand:- start:1036 stop:1527 length:492 start_codon:yes stop_codon:yes gene_type:complete